MMHIKHLIIVKEGKAAVVNEQMLMEWNNLNASKDLVCLTKCHGLLHTI